MWKKNQLQKNTIERGKMVQTSCSYSVYTHEIGLAWFYPLWPSWHVDKRDHSFLDFSLEDTFFARLDPVPMTLEPTLYVVLATHLTLPMLALYSPEAIPWTQPAWGLLALPSCCCLDASDFMSSSPPACVSSSPFFLRHVVTGLWRLDITPVLKSGVIAPQTWLTNQQSFPRDSAAMKWVLLSTLSKRRIRFHTQQRQQQMR